MKSLCSTFVFLLFTSTIVWAQGPSADSPNSPRANPEGIRVWSATEDVLVTATPLSAPPPRADVTDKKFWVVSGALVAGMALDTKSTFDGIDRCRCHEGNPLVAPFVNRGPAVSVTAGLVFDAGVMALAARMRASDKPQLRRIWWLVPVAVTAAHAWGYHHNLGVPGDRR